MEDNLEPFPCCRNEVMDEETPLVMTSVRFDIPDSPKSEKKDVHKSSILSAFSNSILTSMDTIDLKDLQSESDGSIHNFSSSLVTFFKAIPASILVTILNLMLMVPFGSSYLTDVIPLDEDERASIGIRLALLPLAIGQFVMGGGVGIGSSGFGILAVWQLGELSPFYHKFSEIAAATSPDPSYILPTTMFLFSLSSISVAMFCFVLGHFKLGQLTYFFPTYVLLGLVGGIGVWFVNLSITVSTSPSLVPSDFTKIIRVDPHFAICIPCFILLQILRKIFPKEKFMLLDPIFFLSLPIIFYICLYILDIPVEQAMNSGYFFAQPDVTRSSENVSKEIQHQLSTALSNTTQLWSQFSFQKVQYQAAIPALAPLLCSGLLGLLVTSPFIPSTATLQNNNQELDLNREYMSHAWSNLFSAISVPGGLGVAVCYSTSMVYKNAGGQGKIANVFVSLLLFMMVVYGPVLVNYIPRCMASVIILDMGILMSLDAFVEPWKKLDAFEYSSVLIIAFVLNAISMTAGIVAGLVAALFTYMIQSLVDRNPIRIACDTMKVPSSKWRTVAQERILQSLKGRTRIVLFKIQGQLFFGNLSELSEKIFMFLHEKQKAVRGASHVILDFSLVISVDSTAADFIGEMSERIEKKFDAKTIMISGILDQQNRLNLRRSTASTRLSMTSRSIVFSQTSLPRAFSIKRGTQQQLSRDTSSRVSMMMRGPYCSLMKEGLLEGSFYESLDEALIECEDEIILHNDPSAALHFPAFGETEGVNEKDHLAAYLYEKLDEESIENIEILLGYFKREIYNGGDLLWKMNDEALSAKLLIRGSLKATTENASNIMKSKDIECGEIVGLETFIFKQSRRATIQCQNKCVLYSLDRSSFQCLSEENPRASRILDIYLGKALHCRLQHVNGLSGIQDYGF